MKKITLPIDKKSLFINIFNDNITGHTATVSTPIKQGNSINERLSQIFKIPRQIDFHSKPKLIDELLKNSKSQIKINNVFVFDNFSVNGKKIDTNGVLYAIYIKEEVDSTKAQFGRVKMHYPLTFKYEDEEIIIDNKYVLNCVSRAVSDYAFVVNSFEYDFDSDVLNFNITLIGENGIPYSKVFINNKGTGNKFINIFNDDADSYDIEIVSLRQIFGQEVTPDNYLYYMERANERASDIAKLYLEEQQYSSYIKVSSLYPYSLYDFECRLGFSTRYILLFYTTTNIEYFNISSKKLKFINDFKEEVDIIIITDVLGNEIINKYDVDDILSFSKSINSLMIRKE